MRNPAEQVSPNAIEASLRTVRCSPRGGGLVISTSHDAPSGVGTTGVGRVPLRHAASSPTSVHSSPVPHLDSRHVTPADPGAGVEPSRLQPRSSLGAAPRAFSTPPTTAASSRSQGGRSSTGGFPPRAHGTDGPSPDQAPNGRLLITVRNDLASPATPPPPPYAFPRGHGSANDAAPAGGDAARPPRGAAHAEGWPASRSSRSASPRYGSAWLPPHPDDDPTRPIPGPLDRARSLGPGVQASRGPSSAPAPTSTLPATPRSAMMDRMASEIDRLQTERAACGEDLAAARRSAAAAAAELARTRDELARRALTIETLREDKARLAGRLDEALAAAAAAAAAADCAAVRELGSHCDGDAAEVCGGAVCLVSAVCLREKKPPPVPPPTSPLPTPAWRAPLDDVRGAGESFIPRRGQSPLRSSAA